jgi:hypothetical protein
VLIANDAQHFTSDATDAPLLRLLNEPDPGNGLDTPSRIMVDKVTTVRRTRLGAKIGTLGDADRPAVLPFCVVGSEQCAVASQAAEPEPSISCGGPIARCSRAATASEC